MYNSLLIDNSQHYILKEDFIEVLASYLSADEKEAKISLKNIGEHVKDFDHNLPKGNWGRRHKIAQLTLNKLNEKKMGLINVFRVAQTQKNLTGHTNKQAIVIAFEKLLPCIASELIEEVWDRENYDTKEDFFNEVESIKSK